MSKPVSGRPALMPVAGPSVTEREIAYVTEAARTAWYEHANDFRDRFEHAFAAHVGTRYAVALPSCTAGIHLALAAAGIGPGDEVVVPDATWIATAAPVSYVGALPVFADIDPRTWCLGAATVEPCLTPRTRAIIAVDLYGGTPADIDDLRALASSRGILLVEDAAEAIGATNRGRPAGSLGDIGVFSFHGSKTLTTGEGGMLVTDREDIWRRVNCLADHGRAPGPRQFWNDQVAFKYRMSAFQAAFGLAQLERVDELVAHKRRLFSWYREELAPLGDAMMLNCEPPGTVNSYWMITAVLDAALGLDKETVLEQLRARGIDGRPFFYPLSALPAYAETAGVASARGRNRIAADVSRRGVNLPSALKLGRDDVAVAARALREIVSTSGRATRPA